MPTLPVRSQPYAIPEIGNFPTAIDAQNLNDRLGSGMYLHCLSADQFWNAGESAGAVVNALVGMACEPAQFQSFSIIN